MTRKTGSGHEVQYQDEDRYCDGHNNNCDGADMDSTFILALVIIDQTGG